MNRIVWVMLLLMMAVPVFAQKPAGCYCGAKPWNPYGCPGSTRDNFTACTPTTPTTPGDCHTGGKVTTGKTKAECDSYGGDWSPNAVPPATPAPSATPGPSSTPTSSPSATPGATPGASPTGVPTQPPPTPNPSGTPAPTATPASAPAAPNHWYCTSWTNWLYGC